MQPGSQLSINAVEGFPVEDFSPDVSIFPLACQAPVLIQIIQQAVRSQITEAQKIASGSGSEQDIAEAKIELEASSPIGLARSPLILMQVLESLQSSLK